MERGTVGRGLWHPEEGTYPRLGGFRKAPGHSASEVQSRALFLSFSPCFTRPVTQTRGLEPSWVSLTSPRAQATEAASETARPSLHPPSLDPTTRCWLPVS